MLHAFASLLAVVEEEKSKTPFYIAGCIFGAWAILLFALGQKNEAFPGSKGAMTGIIGISVAFAVTCGALVLIIG